MLREHSPTVATSAVGIMGSSFHKDSNHQSVDWYFTGAGLRHWQPDDADAFPWNLSAAFDKVDQALIPKIVEATKCVASTIFDRAPPGPAGEL